MSATNDLLYFESDGGCANCGLRDARALTVHHIEQTTPKNEAYDNKLVLCHNCHQCHHDGKGPSHKDLKEIKRRLIMKTLTIPGLNAMKQAYRKGHVVAMPFLVNHLIEQRLLKHKETVSNWIRGDQDPETVVDMTVVYTITDRGKELLKKWNLN